MVAVTSDRSTQLAAVLVCCGAAVLAFTPSFTEFLHNLLSDSARHPLPKGVQSAYGVVLGYALHR